MPRPVLLSLPGGGADRSSGSSEVMASSVPCDSLSLRDRPHAAHWFVMPPMRFAIRVKAGSSRSQVGGSYAGSGHAARDKLVEVTAGQDTSTLLRSLLGVDH